RDDDVGGTARRRAASRHGAAGRAGHGVLGMEPAHRRRAPGRVRDDRAQRDRVMGRALEKETMSTLLAVTGVTKRFGGFKALDAVDLVVAPGERLGLIG